MLARKCGINDPDTFIANVVAVAGEESAGSLSVVAVDVLVVDVVVVNVVHARLLGLLKIRSFPGDDDDDNDDGDDNDDDRLRRGHEDVAPTHVNARAATEDVVH